MTDVAPGVVIVEDHPVAQIGLAEPVSRAGFDILATGPHVESADLLLDRAAVVLTDLHFDPSKLQNQLAVAHLLRSCPRVLAVSAVAKQQVVLEVVAAGASGYVAKTADVRVLVDALQTVAAGGKFVSPELAAALLADAHDRPLPSRDIASMERALLGRFVRGDNAEEAGRFLGLSPARVAAQLDSIWSLERKRRRYPTYQLTGKEQQVCVAARAGLHHKEMAKALDDIRTSTVVEHLGHIKAKWDLTHPGANSTVPLEAARRFAEDLELDLTVSLSARTKFGAKG